ncbi:GEVED domain-containing protein [Polaribacter uvawellassae]|uniref:GEVED domain-containing protein n=1 Tax=Polaribacter uvawellassae TaxID=3133495 RepID=UPI00321C306B
MSLIYRFTVSLFVVVLSIIPHTVNSQSYCTPSNLGNARNASFFVSKFSLEDIDNVSDLTANSYEYYTNKTAEVIKGQTYAASVTFNIPNYNTGTLNVWIDYNKNGTFESSELVTSYTESQPASSTGITKNFNITIPTSATTGETRIRVAVSRGNSIEPCNLKYQSGEYEDYKIRIKPIPQPPTAICVNNLNINLDILGSATITANDINNGSFDDYDATNDLILSIDKDTFNCNDVGTPQTVTLTVTDLDGLTSTCTTTVTVSLYAGTFEAPALDDITQYCSYTATAPIMEYQCNETIVATTLDPTSFNTAGTYTIDWVFDNGSTQKTSTQTIEIINPTRINPADITISNISNKRADVSWISSDVGPFKIRYRLNGSSDPWLETTSINKSITINNLNDGDEYEVQVKVDASCASYPATTKTFTTFAIIYCNTNLNLSKGNYFISNVTIGDINNTTTSSDPFYNYFDTTGTSLEKGKTFSGTISYTRQSYNDTYLVVWIDFNSDGKFSVNEEVFSIENLGNATTNFTIPLNNILIPETAILGKTRLRVGLSQNQKPLPCNFNHQRGEVEDYNIDLTPIDNSSFESALITQTYHSASTERWIEITNINTSKTIPTNTVVLALYKNKSGDQTGISPTSTFVINTTLTQGETVLIKSNSSTFSNIIGTVITNNDITDFDEENDILIVTKTTGTDAWENRFDVVSNIKSNASMVRTDKVITYNKNFNSAEWINFVDDNLSTTTNPPERHPHAPLLSEITNADNNANIKLGVHHTNSITRESGTWNNGFPDRSRKVLINENLTTTSAINAYKLTITGANKLTINNNSLIVSDSLTIDTNASLRLAGTSQLIQTHTGKKQISGTGKLYIDQTSQLTNLYQSGNWSSPVTTNGTTFSIKSVIKDGTTPTSSTSDPSDITFSSGYDGAKTTPITISSYWLAKLINDVDYTRRINPEQVFMKPSEGWNMKSTGSGTQNFTFKGIPNDGDYTSIISQNRLSLLGNPYPSAIDADKFLLDNSNAISGTLYFYEAGDDTSHIRGQYKGGYATRVIGMGTSFGSGKAPTKYIPVAQAFFVTRSNEGTGTIKFTNSQRISNASNTFFSKNKAAKNVKISNFPVLRLGFEFIVNEPETFLFHREVAVGFRGLSSSKYRIGYDAPMFGRNPTDMALQIPNSETPFTITGVEDFNDAIKIPLSVYLDVDRSVTFKVDALENLDTNVYLQDNLANKEYDLLKNGGVTLELNAGNYYDRFVIKFRNNSLSVDDESLQKESITTYFDTTSKQLVVKNLQQESIRAIKVFSILGQLIFSKNQLGNQSEYKLQLHNQVKTGIYFIKISSDKGTITKKIFINQ